MAKGLIRKRILSRRQKLNIKILKRTITLKNFRGFKSAERVNISPITILIGENSSGKTSFISAVDYIYNFIMGGILSGKIYSPFTLGSFEQVAHFRGGRGGRAKEISVKLEIEYKKSNEVRSFSLEVCLKNVASIAVERRVTLRDGKSSLIIDAEKNIIILKSEKSRFKTEMPLPKNIEAIKGGLMLDSLLGMVEFRISEYDLESSHSKKRDGKKIIQNIEEGLRILVLSAFYTTSISPIRVRPQRTYTLSSYITDLDEEEGENVPFEMAKLYTSNKKEEKERWESLKRRIIEFGLKSGLLNDINIKAFGKSINDPFQLEISFGGPKRNIVDVGYGVSQILPILYNLNNKTEKDMILIQQPEIHLHPKAQAALGSYFVEQQKRTKSYYIIETHSDYIIDRIRSEIRNKITSPDNISLLFFERDRLDNKIHEVKIKEDGTLHNPPKSYLEFFIDEYKKILGV